jgi:hypothetical protein
LGGELEWGAEREREGVLYSKTLGSFACGFPLLLLLPPPILYIFGVGISYAGFLDLSICIAFVSFLLCCVSVFAFLAFGVWMVIRKALGLGFVAC